MAGQLLNDAGQPITNARVAVLTRDIDDDDAKLRTYITTDGEGRFSYRATAYASRLYQFAWTSHVNDVRFAANGYVTLLARATSTLNPSPRSVRVGQRVKLYGRLAGKRPRRSVDIVAQGRAGKRGSFRTFADGTIGRDGRFRVLLPLPRPGLARAHVPVPYQDRARQRLRLLGRLFAHREGEGSLKKLFAAVAPLAAALALAAPAQAGTYDVHFCNSTGTVFDNKSWAALTSPGIVTDPACAATNTLIGIRVDAGTRSAAGAIGGLTFTSPAGTAITDFTLTRQLDYKNPVVSGTRPFFTLYQLGTIVFAGAGDYEDATRTRLNAQRSWYGYPANEAHLARANTTRANFPALAAYRNNARTLLLRAGCYRRNTAPCEVGPGGRIYNVFYGAKVTVSDPTPPASANVEAAGLFAGGPRDGSDPVTVSAADNAGIKRVEIVDVSNPSAARVVGAENYDVGFTYEAGEQRTDAGRHLLVPARQAVPEPQRRDDPPERAPGRPPQPAGALRRRRRQRRRPRPVPRRRRHAVRPRRRQRLQRQGAGPRPAALLQHQARPPDRPVLPRRSASAGG